MSPHTATINNIYIYYSDAHEASFHHQMDENGKDLFSGQ